MVNEFFRINVILMFSNFVDYFCCFSCLKRSHLSNSRPEDCSDEKSSQKMRAEANSIITKMLQNLAEKQAQHDTPLINESQLNKCAYSIVQSLLAKVKLEFKETQVNFKLFFYFVYLTYDAHLLS
jgi:hypothetical protein